MSVLNNAKILAEIAKLGSEIYGLIVDKSRAMAERDQRIKELERQVAELKARIG